MRKGSKFLYKPAFTQQQQNNLSPLRPPSAPPALPFSPVAILREASSQDLSWSCIYRLLSFCSLLLLNPFPRRLPYRQKRLRYAVGSGEWGAGRGPDHRLCCLVSKLYDFCVLLDTVSMYVLILKS